MQCQALRRVNSEACPQQSGDDGACDSRVRTPLSAQCMNNTFAPASLWALAQGLGTGLLVAWVCFVAAARNPYGGGGGGKVCLAQIWDLPFLRATQLMGLVYGRSLCQSETKSLHQELLVACIEDCSCLSFILGLTALNTTTGLWLVTPRHQPRYHQKKKKYQL